MLFRQAVVALTLIVFETKKAAAADACTQLGIPACKELADPALQYDVTAFTEEAPNALDYIADATNSDHPVTITTKQTVQMTGLVECVDDMNPTTCAKVGTTVWGYKTPDGPPTWPGPTIIANRDCPVEVNWVNGLLPDKVMDHPMTSLEGKSVLDPSLHWAYSLHGFQGVDDLAFGLPIVTHLHGGHSTPEADGYPEAFYSAGGLFGPDFVSTTNRYENDQPAGTLWYHDHSLGITRLNVYAGLAGFYLIRDHLDSGIPWDGNTYEHPLNLPTGDFELAYAIQDRMFKKNGELFIPAYEGEPYYNDFITGEGATPPEGQATAMAEFFGDFMVVNGKIWPKKNVYPRKYRIRFVNGCDSRFLVIKFVTELDAATTYSSSLPASQELEYTVIGTDQGLLNKADVKKVKSSLIEPGARLDIVIDFSQVGHGERVIVKNFGGDAPFGGLESVETIFEHTDKIMAFDIIPLTKDLENKDDPDLHFDHWPVYHPEEVDNIRRVGLFEGNDEFGRLQPLLGGEFREGVVETFVWDDAATETPHLDDVEEWEIFNFSGDAHPVHLHLVHFEVVARYNITYDSRTADGLPDMDGDGIPDTNGQTCYDLQPLDGVCIDPAPTYQHNGAIGKGFKALFPPGMNGERIGYNKTQPIVLGKEYAAENGGRKDMVTALPGQVTIIRAKFDIPGKYVWHCHILSHEDHEMMRDFVVQKKRRHVDDPAHTDEPPATKCTTPCQQISDCYDATNTAGLDKACGNVDCVKGTCMYVAWNEQGTCEHTNFLECGGDDSVCTKGPSGLNYEGTCSGYGNNECIYKWCPGDEAVP